MRHRFVATTKAGLAIAWLTAAAVAAQTPPAQAPPAPQTPAPQTPAPAAGRGPLGGRGQAVFPAQQRELADAATIERGRTIYTVSCTACHGADLRGGQLGGPNLLRSALVLGDGHGELIAPIVKGARQERGMPPMPLSDQDIVAVAEYIHSVAASMRNQGMPPATGQPPPDALVGNAKAGETYFASKCSECHSVTGDLQGIGARFPDAKTLQNFWVPGGRGGRGGAGVASDRRTVTATITLSSGEKVAGRLVRIDDFFVTLGLADGTQQTFRRDGDKPKVDVKDPLESHRALLLDYTDDNMRDVTAYLVTIK